jgi:hypothetical protein
MHDSAAASALERGNRDAGYTGAMQAVNPPG